MTLPAPVAGDIVKFGRDGGYVVYNTDRPYVIRGRAGGGGYEWKVDVNDPSWAYDIDAMLEEVKKHDTESARLQAKLQTVCSVAPETLNVNGIVDEKKGVEYLGLATRMANGKWRCAAIVGTAICVVEATITFGDPPP